MIWGYFNDMYIAIQQQIQILLPGGYIVIAVSGSKHDPLILPTDIAILDKLWEWSRTDKLEIS